MELKLDIDEKQLELLNKDISEFYRSLSKKQRMKMINEFVDKRLNNLFDNAYKERGGKYTVYDADLIDLLNKNANSKVLEWFSNNERADLMIKDKIDKISERIPEIITRSIISYVANCIFLKKDEVYNMINAETMIMLENDKHQRGV